MHRRPPDDRSMPTSRTPRRKATHSLHNGGPNPGLEPHRDPAMADVLRTKLAAPAAMGPPLPTPSPRDLLLGATSGTKQTEIVGRMTAKTVRPRSPPGRPTRPPCAVLRSGDGAQRSIPHSIQRAGRLLTQLRRSDERVGTRRSRVRRDEVSEGSSQEPSGEDHARTNIRWAPRRA